MAFLRNIGTNGKWNPFVIVAFMASAFTFSFLCFVTDVRSSFKNQMLLTGSNSSIVAFPGKTEGTFPGYIGGTTHFTSSPETCKCQSMFTVGACGMDQVISIRPKDAVWVSAVAGLRRARTKKDVQMMPHLQTLARYLPQLFRFNITRATKASTINITANKHLSRATERMPFLSCQIHLYTPSEVRMCTEKHLLETGQPLRLAFVGDSRVRNTMQQMLRSTLHEMHYRLASESEEIEISLSFLSQRSKANIPVVGDGLEMRLYWSAYLEENRNPADVSQQGARDLLEAWASGNPKPADGPIPEVAYITTGLWDSSMLPEDKAVSSFIKIMHIMAPTLKRLANRTRVIWHIHGPIKEWLATRDIPNSGLDMMNRAAWHWLGDSNIWLWDSHTVMMLREYGECRRFRKSALQKFVPYEWGCHDFQHAGRDVEDAATNMLWNLVCNPILKLSPEHCCS